MMRLHLLGLAHTVTSDAFSHCAFSAKCLKFPAMMAPLDYEVTHYGVEGAEVACEHVTVMSRAEQERLRGRVAGAIGFVGDDADIGNKLYKEFNRRLRHELQQRVEPGDLVLLPFGWGHADAVNGLPFTLVESGIGYPNLYTGAHHRIYESYAWLHFHQGRENRNGKNYEWVIPNYFDIDAWDVNLAPDPERVVFMGRICDIKGLRTVVEVAKHRPDLHFTICGQGDPAPYLTQPNIEYVPPISGRARSAYLGNALACIMPTDFTEPFGGVAVEAQMCGTPVLTTPFGAFTETVEDQVTGFRCHTLGDFLAALERIPSLDRGYVAARARRLYGFEHVGRMYDRAFRMIDDLRGVGWYSFRSAFGPVTKAAADRSWQNAQQHELNFHMRSDLRSNEQRKRLQYAGMMNISEATVAGAKVLDVGCGPESLMLSYPVAAGSVGLDPLRFTDEDEARYRGCGIERAIGPAETFPGTGFDEAWSYNCLQHVQDPEAILRMMKRAGKVIRLFEWVNVKADIMHLHVLTIDRINAVLGVPETEMHGSWRQPGFPPDEFYAAVWHV